MLLRGLFRVSDERSKFGAWAVAHTHTHREAVALRNLARQDFDAYCPMFARRIRHARKGRDVRRPLFPGYLFIALDPDHQQWRSIRSTIGIHSLIGHGDRPSLLANGFVESLKARENDGVVTGAAFDLRKGQSVRLLGGPFDGLAATITDYDQNDRVTLLLNMLNRKVRATVPLDSVVIS